MRSLLLPALLVWALAPSALRANNITISNVTLTGQVAASDTWQVQFDISWENSWRTSTAEANHDAAWVFIKFRAGLDPTWRHATLSAGGHVGPLAPASDQKGAFIRRNVDGIGSFSSTGVQLRWNYGASGVADNDLIEVRVLAIEMVLVPQGAFVVGDGTSTGIERHFEAGNSGAPFTISSEAALTLGGTAATNLCNHNNVTTGGGNNDDFNYTTTTTLPAAFPKGFNAFYLMKYECTQGQYVDFLNMLTATQASARFAGMSASTGVGGLTIDDTGTAPELYVTTTPERGCGTIALPDLLAYADWTALRPMSELEYEKACRGNRPAVANEYAWATTSLRGSQYTATNAGAANETVNAIGTEGNANIQGLLVPGRPLRTGIFSGSLVSPDRQASGAGYYGAMELSGNLDEMTISVGTVAARTFTGGHGDGALTAGGLADVSGWPSTGSPISLRGSGFSNVSAPVTNRLRVSSRSLPNQGVASGSDTGIRLCRLP